MRWHCVVVPYSLAWCVLCAGLAGESIFASATVNTRRDHWVSVLLCCSCLKPATYRALQRQRVASCLAVCYCCCNSN
uniref:Putative secreted protein n=1 Tax=Anopheles darlingi TaxID=43151 RepID=A0A2M4D695_ANODA